MRDTFHCPFGSPDCTSENRCGYCTGKTPLPTHRDNANPLVLRETQATLDDDDEINDSQCFVCLEKDREIERLRAIKVRAEYAGSIARSEAVKSAVAYILEGPQTQQSKGSPKKCICQHYKEPDCGISGCNGHSVWCPLSTEQQHTQQAFREVSD